MIIKPFELRNFEFSDFKAFLLFGSNRGYKNQVTDTHLLTNFKGEISRYEEGEILENNNTVLESLINGSLFNEAKILIISLESVLNKQ